MASYKTCVHYNKSIGKRRKYAPKQECKLSENKRMCRRCPQLPAKKLSEFKDELKVRKEQEELEESETRIEKACMSE